MTSRCRRTRGGASDDSRETSDSRAAVVCIEYAAACLVADARRAIAGDEHAARNIAAAYCVLAGRSYARIAALVEEAAQHRARIVATGDTMAGERPNGWPAEPASRRRSRILLDVIAVAFPEDAPRGRGWRAVNVDFADDLLARWTPDRPGRGKLSTTGIVARLVRAAGAFGHHAGEDIDAVRKTIDASLAKHGRIPF